MEYRKLPQKTQTMRKKKLKSKKHSACWRRLLLVVLGLLLGVNAYLANARGLAGNQMPMPFGTGMAVVLSGSMEPTLRVNDVIIVHEQDSYEPGDIIVYQSGYELIVHRVIAVDGETVITQGDANNIADPPVSVSDVKGAVIGHIPAIGMLVNALKTPVGIILILVCALLLIEFSFRRQKETDDEKTEAIKEEIRRLRAEQEKDLEKKD